MLALWCSSWAALRLWASGANPVRHPRSPFGSAPVAAWSCGSLWRPLFAARVRRRRQVCIPLPSVVPPCSGRGVLLVFVVCSAPVAAWSCRSLWRPLCAARVRRPRQVCMPPCACCSLPVFWAWSFVPLGGVFSSYGRLELWESLASPVRRPRQVCMPPCPCCSLPPCSGRGVLFLLVVCSAPVAAWSCGSLWRPLFAARVRRPRQVCMPPCPFCSLPRVLGVAFCSSWWCVQLLWPAGAVRVSGVPCWPPAFAVRVRCVCPLVPFVTPCSGRGVLFVLVVCSAPVAAWSCGSLWRPLFAARVRRPRQVCMPLVPVVPSPRVLGVEFCSSSWCVQLLWPPGAVGVSGVPCWPPAFAVRVRCVCPLSLLFPPPVFWAWSFVLLRGVFSSCGRLELWESLASLLAARVRRPRQVCMPLVPFVPRVLGVEFCFVLVVCSAPVAAWSCGSLWRPLLAARVRRPRQVCMPPCPCCSLPRVLGLEFCSSWWCVQLLWPPAAVGVSGVPCSPPAFAVRVRCVCPLGPCCSLPPVFWAWSFVRLGGVFSSCGRLELWESLASPWDSPPAFAVRVRCVCPLGPCCSLPPLFWAWSFVRLGGVFSSCGRLELWESLASPVRRPRSPSASGVYAPWSLLFPPPCSGRGVLFVLVVCSAPVAAWSCGSLWRPLFAARVRRPRQVCMPPWSLLFPPPPLVLGVEFCSSWWCVQLLCRLELWESLASPVRRPRSPSASGVYAPCLCCSLPPCSGRGVLFVLVVCSAPVAAWSCGSLWRPLFATRVRRPRQVCMPPCPCCSLPPCSGVEFCSSSWCVQLL